MNTEALEAFQERLGYAFKDRNLLKSALTHASAGIAHNYERLEFLGDRVVGLVLAHWLYEVFPGEEEGDLAKRHAALVQGKTLAQIARGLNLGAAIKLSESERASGGSGNDNILADSLEAVIGALYLDGEFVVCRDTVRALWGDLVHVLDKPPQDPKTALQEWAQARGLPLPVYELSHRAGPDHAPVFEIKAIVEGYPPFAAAGPSRRAAEKDAAARLLAHLCGCES